MLKDLLDVKEKCQLYLYDKGFLITDRKDIDISVYPFYNNWEKTEVFNYSFLIHKRAKSYFFHDKEKVFFLIGHAFDPISKIYYEEEILEQLSKLFGTSEYRNKVDSLTGVFVLGVIKEGSIIIEPDCSSMQYCCYGKVENNIYITSHMRLIGDLTSVKTDQYVERLTNYKWYKFMLGNYLPGNITCYKEVKRIVPNTIMEYDGQNFIITRIYPNKKICMAETDSDYESIIEKASCILKNTMEIIPKKWNKPAISLTGGIDSNTTFAAANGVYNKYTAFSYVSMDREEVDAQTARKIAQRFDVPHKIFEVPNSNEEIEDFDTLKMVLKRNGGDIGSVKDNDIRKKITLIRNVDFDVEVKSWVSETVRAYIYKYFGRKKMPKNLRARHYTSLYKIFIGRRILCKKTDGYFKKYFNETNLKENLFNFDESDIFVWEMEHGEKCGLDIGVMKSCFDICIPYNNRVLLETLLRVPLDKRISDQHHLDLKKKLNKDLYDMNIRVVNLNETKKRKRIINLYFIINSLLPF